MMKFTDAVTITGTRTTGDGYLVADARVARTGIQIYLGTEVGKPDQYAVRVYRPPAEVFSSDSMGSYAHKPLTNDHPAEGVTADTWRKLAVGNMGDSVARDGEFVRVPLIIMDSAAIADVNSGKRELSAGYTCDLVFDAGKTDDGQEYDAVQKNIRVNHVAIVQRGRAGSQARIGDEWGAVPLNDNATEDIATMATRNVMVDGYQVETTDAGAIAIEKLSKDKADLTTRLAAADKALADANTAHATAIAAKDTEIGTLKVDLQKAKDGAPNVDKLVADRVSLVSTARAIQADVKVDGVSDADIRRAVVTAKMGDVADASDAEITGMFKALARDIKPADPMRDAMMGRTVPTIDADKAVNDARAQMIADLKAGKVDKVA